MFEIENIPRLIEHHAGYYLNRTLQSCHNNRVQLYSLIFNIAVTLLFVAIGIITLYTCAKRKKSPEQKKQDAIRDQQYIMEKIRGLQHQREVMLASKSITGMPMTSEVSQEAPLQYSRQIPAFA